MAPRTRAAVGRRRRRRQPALHPWPQAQAQPELRASHYVPRRRVAMLECTRQPVVRHPVLAFDAAQLKRIEQHPLAGLNVEEDSLPGVVCALAVIDGVVQTHRRVVKLAVRVGDDLAALPPDRAARPAHGVHDGPHVPPALRVSNKDEPTTAQEIGRSAWADMAEAAARRRRRAPHPAIRPVARAEGGEARGRVARAGGHWQLFFLLSDALCIGAKHRICEMPKSNPKVHETDHPTPNPFDKEAGGNTEDITKAATRKRFSPQSKKL